MAFSRRLSLGNIDFPCEVVFNNDLVYRRGTLPPGPSWVQSSSPAVFRLPPSLWKPLGQTNIVSVRLYAPGPEVRLPSPSLIGDSSFVQFQFDVIHLLNGEFFFLFAGINLVGGLYFFTMWLGRREDWSRFYFAVSTLFMGLYFLEQGCPVALVSVEGYKAFIKACLSWSVGFAMAASSTATSATPSWPSMPAEASGPSAAPWPCAPVWPNTTPAG